MGNKKKLLRFEENKTFSNLFQWPSVPDTPDMDMKGKWNEAYFGNTNPIVVELGCGKGDYTIGLARMNKDCNYIGIDIKGSRLWRGCKTAIEESIDNVAFVRIQVEFIDKVFAENEVSEIWITFPDPQPNKIRKRLTCPMFLNRYMKVLRNEGIVNLKTDDDDLYDYTANEVVAAMNLETFANTNDLYKEKSEIFFKAQALQTYYESIWLKAGKKIKYISFHLKNKLNKV